MPYAFVEDVPASWHDYKRVTAALLEPAPSGLILHVAGPTDEGVRIINIWESEEAWSAFQSECLAPGMAALGSPEPRFRDVYAADMVVGSVLAEAPPRSITASRQDDT